MITVQPAHAPRPGPAQGAASLTVLLLLLLTSLLVCAWGQRNVMAELRSAQVQVQAAVALEAAEAGLAWAQGQLNSAESLGPGCGAAVAATASTGRFSTRYLGEPDARGWFTPLTREFAGSRQPRQAACALLATGWVCDCPADAAPSLSWVDGAALAASFTVQFTALPQARLVQVDVTGCNDWAPPCKGSGTGRAEAVSRLRISLALLPSLATPPAATLISRGALSADGAVGLSNADALTGGLVAQLGGQVTQSMPRIRTAPGTAPGLAMVTGDTALAALTPTQLFGRHLGSSVAEWMQQPGVQTMDCGGDCSTELLRAINTQTDLARIGVRGRLALGGALVIGSPTRPVLLVVDGPLHLTGPVQIHGVVMAERLQWDGVAQDEGGLLHGAAVLAGALSGTGAPELVYDPALMRRLTRQHGLWLRVPGSWKDH